MSLQPPPSREKLPVNNGWAEMPRAWIKYFNDLASQVGTAASTAWDSVSKSGSSLADLETRNHSSLQNLNTADYSHLYLADRDNLVSGEDTVLHYHDSDRDSDNFTGTEWTDLTDAGVTALHQHDFTTISYPTTYKIGDPTHIDTLQEIHNHSFSSGVMDGCDATDNGDGTVSFATGSAMIRSSADAHVPLYAVVVPEQANLALTDDATNYVYLDYNAGVPQFVASTSITSFNCLDKCIAFMIHRDGNTLHIADAREQNVDGNRKMRRLFLGFSRFIHYEDGTALGSSGLALTVTAGTFSFMVTEFPHVAFDTSVAGTANANVFKLWYRNGAGGWTGTANEKTITSTTYDDNSGTPATLGNNKFGVSWVYIAHDAPSVLQVVMGQAEYASLSDARVTTPPTSIPSILSGMGSLVGFVIYEKSAVAFDSVESAFTTTFSHSSPTSHEGLPDLLGGSVADGHYHLTATQATDLTDGGVTSLHSHAGGGNPSNVISTATTVSADTSYPAIGYLTITSDLTIEGNLGVF